MEWPYSRRCDASSPKGQSERHFNSKQTTTLAHLSYCSLPVVSLFLFLFVVGRVCTSTFPLPAVPSEKLLILRQHHTSGPLRASFFFFFVFLFSIAFPFPSQGRKHTNANASACASSSWVTFQTTCSGLQSSATTNQKTSLSDLKFK